MSGGVCRLARYLTAARTGAGQNASGVLVAEVGLRYRDGHGFSLIGQSYICGFRSYMAMAVISALVRKGLRVPEDIR